MRDWKARAFEIENLQANRQRPNAPATTEPIGKKRLKREMEREALKRLEDAARTTEDFESIVTWWNRLDDNRERRERYHEISRGGNKLPLDFGAAENGILFPDGLNNMLTKQIRKGEFWDAIYFCPCEIHELVTEAFLSHVLQSLPDERKNLLFLLAVLQCSVRQIAQLWSQTDRGVRKARSILFQKLYQEIVICFSAEQYDPSEMTVEERAFLQAQQNGLDDARRSLYNGNRI